MSATWTFGDLHRRWCRGMEHPMATIIDRIRDAVRDQPFRPFGVRLADGSVHTVADQVFIAIPPGPRPRDIIFFVETAFPDRYETHWVDSALIPGVMVPGSEKAPGTADSTRERTGPHRSPTPHRV